MSKNLSNTLMMLHDLKAQFTQADSPSVEKGYGSIKRANRASRSRALEDEAEELQHKIDLIFEEASGISRKNNQADWQ